MTAIKTRGEVFTPQNIINEMLDTLPIDVWKNPDLKWLDPCVGHGQFPISILERLMMGLKQVIPEKEERKKHILENMIYMVELHKPSIDIVNEKLEGSKYNLNIYEGSFIDYRHFTKVELPFIFDIIVGNPPYQHHEEGHKRTFSIWDLFVKRSSKIIREDGYLLYIHPSGWRDINGYKRHIFNYIKEHNLIYLSINSYSKGAKVFKVSTNYDFYLLQHKKTNTNITRVNDIDDILYDIDLNKWEFIPNGMFKEIEKLLSTDDRVCCINKDKCTIREYETVKKYQDEVFKYPCVYTISIKDGITLYYSSIYRHHTNIPKVIWSNGSGLPFIDYEGKYMITDFGYAIVDEKENLPKILEALLNKDFKKIMSYLIFKKNTKYNCKIIALFKKDFYKDFIST